MSEEKRYNDEQWDDLPLPDGELAWQKMELLLDKDKKRRVVPFWFWRYAGLGLILIGLSVGAWFMWGKTEDNSQSNLVTQKDSSRTTSKQITKTDKISSSPSAPEEPSAKEKKGIPVTNDQPLQTTTSLKTGESKEPIVAKKAPRKQTQTSQIDRTTKRADRTSNREPDTKTFADKPEKKQASSPTLPVTGPKQSLIDSTKIASVPVTDSTAKKDTVATKAAEPMASNEKKKDSGTKRNPFVFTAGVGLQQAIAFGGQESSIYNYKGKQNSLSDRIPSVYLRLQKGKWFAQAEFQYAVPQPVKQVSFSQKTRYDVASFNLNTEQLTIRKLYYHQLPVSVNYFVLPNWSVGTGAMYSILAGAVTEQEVASKNVQTGTESVARSIAPVEGYKDSFLYKSTAGILFQTDYHWKRFSLGLRYTQNLEPFIKYTRPDGAVLNEKNRLLQAILRFRLF